MALCDELESTEKELETLEKHFIEYLPKSILQLAVQGKLVAQNIHDEPASVLLERIQKEKAQLIKDGKIKQEKTLPPIAEDEIPYDLPDGWVWCRLGDIVSKIHYGFTASAQSKGLAKLLRISDIQDNSVNWDSVPFCDIEEKRVSDYSLSENDILIARTGGTIGKTYLVRDTDSNVVFASYLIRIIPFPVIYNVSYLKYYLESPLYWKQLMDKSMGTGQPNVNGQSLSSLTVPLPPLAEQQRIVAKVDELMALCEELSSAKDAPVKYIGDAHVVPFLQTQEDEPLRMVAQGTPAQVQSKELKQAIDDLFGDDDNA